MKHSVTTKRAHESFRDSKYFLFVTFVFRIILAAVFIAAAVSKIPDLYHFQLTVASYHILPLWAVPAFANTLPFVELILGAALIAGFKTKWAVSGTVFLLVIFIIALGINLYRGSEAICGCFGVESGGAEIGWQTIERDVILLLLCVQVYFTKKHVWSVDSVISKRRK